jgi:glycosyltransferase involved in cell wall biosynthesis
LFLLEALQLLAQRCDLRVNCDFYGPIHDEIRKEFLCQLDVTPNARYCGMAQAGSGPSVIAGYDALVLPTFFACEGHPGVIIEAMHAGVPVISTQHRAIPELVVDGENGILVPVRDSHALAEAIKQIALDRPLRERMGQANYRKGQEFHTEVVVAQMMKIIFPE